MSNDKADIAQLWMNHSNHFWSQVRALPFIETVVLAGSYELYKDCEAPMAALVLFVGFVLFVIITLILLRHRQHVKAFREAAGNAIPETPRALFGWHSDYMAILISLLLAILNLGLCCVLIFCNRF